MITNPIRDDHATMPHDVSHVLCHLTLAAMAHTMFPLASLGGDLDELTISTLRQFGSAWETVPSSAMIYLQNTAIFHFDLQR